MAKISKKQRSALKEIDKLAKERKNDQILAVISIAIMAVLIAVYNLLVYQMGVIDEGNVYVRAVLYIAAMVAAGFSGIKFMNASKKQRTIDGYRQSTSISRETLDAWRRGEIE